MNAKQGRDTVEATDSSWVSLKELRELVAKADELGWEDHCLVSHSISGSDHPTLRGLQCARRIVVEHGR